MAARSTVAVLARVADGLTASRLVLALVVFVAVETGAWRTAAVVTAVAWWSDFLDGRIARSTEGTRLGEWDPYVDTLFGVAIVIGFAAGGHVPALPWLVAAFGLGGAYVATGNFAFGQLAQALGYGLLLWMAAAEEATALAVLVGTIVAIAILDRRRLAEHTLPTFFEGVGLRKR